MGLTRGTTREHIARAALESMAFQTRELLEAMQQDAGVELSALRQRRDALVSTPGATLLAAQNFAACMDGPSGSRLNRRCLPHDRNGDGSVDLRDFSVMQLAYATPLP